ncbi:hypothetical protein LOTGIDRAFT_130505 [Lottia gigantea]|uniref:UDP-D-xylose:beta-D-glucoside alpha-1,3-D-xylosyltransferase n=1 Tax=Lottia gigantea TaxID=225164 RepID=V3ZT94_LOTGI|nr:hypothetical protein LOTGIDRAFT_130505 [Lottia gigantea]ESO85785.1 hypothetical protein LOTGIDRAFT_130505 [Lottia gigantea]
MLFKFGVTVIVLVAIVIYFVGNKDNGQVDDVILQLKDKVKEERGAKNYGPDLSKEIHENSKDGEASKLKVIPGHKYKKNAIHLCVVACGDRFPEISVLLKSAVILTSTPLVFHIFAEKELQQNFKDHLEFWPHKFRSQIDYFIYDLQFPNDGNGQKWKELFKPCASQRLFVPQILTDVDSLIYVDSDVLFISSIDQLYHHFTLFNSTQLAGFTLESEDLATGWYNRFARHPYYGVVGVNSGVMLMNLTRLRQSQFLSSVKRYYDEYHLKLTWGDQDLINIYFHYFPHQIFILSCEYNYRADHCMYMSVCKKSEEDGVKLLHGSRRIFFNEKQPAFKAVYTALKDHLFSSSVRYQLVTKIKRLLKDTEHTSCGKLGSNKDIFTKQLELNEVS